MQRRFLSSCLWVAVLGACSVVAGGCSIIDAIDRALNPPPALEAIGENKVLVLPFAPLNVRQVAPDLETEVTSILVGEMQEVFFDASFVSAETLRAWRAKNLNWRGMLTPEIGKAFEADLVFEINIFKFSTRDRPGGMVQQGQLGWEARLVNVEDGKRLWKMGRDQVRWPATPEYFVNEISEDTVKANVIRRFAETFVYRFVEGYKGGS